MHQQQGSDFKNNYSATYDKLKEIIESEFDWSPSERSVDEVYKNLLLGDGCAAKDLELLKRLSVTHILNASQGEDTLRYVDTNEDYYKNLNYPCKFMGIPAMDVTAYQLHTYFRPAVEFIEDGLKNSSPEGKVLVHCLQGMSRSATLVIAYLMISKGIHVVEATKLVQRERNIYPNDGFLQQLCDLHFELHSN